MKPQPMRVRGNNVRQRITSLAVRVAVSIVIFFFSAELLSLGWYFLSHDGLFYTSDRSQFPIKAEEVETREGEVETGELANLRFHPYFGFSGYPELGNNHNFYFAGDYPYVRNNENEYIIGVFGGSVAVNFVYEGNDYLEGRTRFIENLKQHPFFEDKQIIILPFCVGGYKQPQQLLVLSYYLALGQELDMVIDIDGFNEVALSNLNNEHGIDFAMPNAAAMLPMINLIDQTTLTSEKLESLAKIGRYRARLSSIAQKTKETKLASAYFLLEQFHKILYSRYTGELVAFQQLESNPSSESLIFIYTMATLEHSVLFEKIASHWANCSILMGQMLRSKGILYYHFLQPNQYYSGKVFGDEEAEIALSENSHPYRTGVREGYPALISKSGFLRQHGVNFYSAVSIFDDEPGMIYVDNCCHFNQHGNELLADFIASSILESEDFRRVIE